MGGEDLVLLKEGLPWPVLWGHPGRVHSLRRWWSPDQGFPALFMSKTNLPSIPHASPLPQFLESVLILHPSPCRLPAPSFLVPVTHQSGPLSPPLGRPSLPGSPTPWAAGSLTLGDSGPTPAGVEILVLGKGGTLRIMSSRFCFLNVRAW